MIVVIDHGLGNLLSVCNALESVAGEEPVVVTSSPEPLVTADRIVIPGVGNYQQGMNNLEALGLVEPLRDAVINKRIPMLGICLGMQLLAETGEEYGQRQGLSFIPGRVRELDAGGFEIPHLGWDDIEIINHSSLFPADAGERDYYFVHSYVFDCPSKYVLAWCDYGEKFPAAVQKDNIFGIQFHPEKSRSAGLDILRNFLRGKECSKSAWFLSSF